MVQITQFIIVRNEPLYFSYLFSFVGDLIQPHYFTYMLTPPKFVTLMFNFYLYPIAYLTYSLGSPKSILNGTYLMVIKTTYDKPIVNIILNHEKLKTFHLRSGTR